MDYKVDDVVECVNSARVGMDLTEGNQYTIASIEDDGMLKVVGCPHKSFYIRRFKLMRRGDKDYSKVTSEMTQKFYMVFREDSRLPEVKHTSAAKATAEAQRLAKKHPGSKIFILETVDCFLCSVSEPESIDLEEL